MPYAREAKSFIEIQRWAKTHTPPDALFISDPTTFGGWREYSERSHFGYLSEWGFSTLCYLGNLETFKEGRHRCQEFGIRLDEFAQKKSSMKPKQLLKTYEEFVRYAFYSLSPSGIAQLTLKYGIDYFVLKKSIYSKVKQKGFDNLPVAYENEYFIVFSTDPIQSYYNRHK